jgi:hypothetical protein
LIIGRFTASRAARGAASPSTRIRSAAASISALTAHPGKGQAELGDELALDLVDAAAEGEHQAALGLHVQPVHELGRRGVGGIPMAADDLLEQPEDALRPLGGEDLRGRRVGDVHLAGRT